MIKSKKFLLWFIGIGFLIVMLVLHFWGDKLNQLTNGWLGFFALVMFFLAPFALLGVLIWMSIGYRKTKKEKVFLPKLDDTPKETPEEIVVINKNGIAQIQPGFFILCLGSFHYSRYSDTAVEDMEMIDFAKASANDNAVVLVRTKSSIYVWTDDTLRISRECPKLGCFTGYQGIFVITDYH